MDEQEAAVCLCVCDCVALDLLCVRVVGRARVCVLQTNSITHPTTTATIPCVTSCG